MNFAYETYKNVESSKNFSNKKEMQEYRSLLMDRVYKKEIPFFKKKFPKGLGEILEIGSGNSRILYALEKENLITTGTGLEISPSRSEFANIWKKDLKSKNVKNICGDFLSINIKEKFDTILCLTSIFPFFDMLQKNGFNTFLKKVNQLLNPNGILILESVTFKQEITSAITFGGKVNLWAEFKKSDPFQFNLVEYAWDKKKRELTATTYNTMRQKLYIDGPTIKKWHMEERKSIEQKLIKNGFKIEAVYGGYSSNPYKDNSLEYIFVAKKIK
ncbi:MAG: class I SAM-dependent methyltransferase [Patescibacteria group bacterium]|nr:class I SAM-dependent methyltransferase [Patescibacteria group bacterium]